MISVTKSQSTVMNIMHVSMRVNVRIIERTIRSNGIGICAYNNCRPIYLILGLLSWQKLFKTVVQVSYASSPSSLISVTKIQSTVIKYHMRVDIERKRSNKVL